jgi:HK97 family phage prohead protease
MAVKLRAIAKRQDEPADGDVDETPEGLAAAVDAALDGALDAIQAGEVDQGLALVTAAATSIDELLDVLGVTDADEVGAEPAGARSAIASVGGVERRSILQPIRLEERADGGMPKLLGHAAVFNSKSEDLGFFYEFIRPGAFQDCLGIYDTACLKNHDPNYLIARLSNGTLLLQEDKRGLYQEAEPNDTQSCRDTIQEVRRLDLNGQSFSFDIEDDTWRTENGVPVREILKVRTLYDVGPVVFPAYPATDVKARGLMAARGLDVEGFSSAIVKQLRRIPLTPADRDIVKRAIAVLQLTEEDNRQEPVAPVAESAAPEAWRFAHLRRRLELAALSA